MIKVKTRGGGFAVVYAVIPKSDYPIRGCVDTYEDCWTITGSRFKGETSRYDLMFDGVDLLSVTIGANGELPERSDAVLSHAESEMGKLHEEIKALKDKIESLNREKAALVYTNKRLNNARLERIATAAMQGLLSNSGIIDIHYEREINWIKEHAMSQALALIEALDKEKAE